MRAAVFAKGAAALDAFDAPASSPTVVRPEAIQPRR